ncbi:MAG TPA: cytidine deaminase, partial [Opitutus sp.]|nr:cytidine deaminase [Opitutus sp.]
HGSAWAHIRVARAAKYPHDGSMTIPTRRTWQQLEKAARQAARSAYAPYSGFAVGAAVFTGSQKIFAGCNVENASYGLCNCAERTAIFSAAAAGEREIRAMVVYTPTAVPTAPCGACRQVINEFGPAALVISICDGTARLETRLDLLLPDAFGPNDLSRGTKAGDRRRPQAGRTR